MKKLLLCGYVLFLAVGMSTYAIAAPCHISDVTGSIKCDYGDDKNDKWSDKTEQVNDDSMFGFTDWLFLEKYDEKDGAEQNVDIGLIVTITPDKDNREGTWDIDDWLKPDGMTEYENLMIVLKGGKGDYAGYLLDDETQPISGEWFTDKVLDAGLSHLSIYGQGTTPISEPATMLLLGAGLIGLAGFGRKRILKKK